MSAQLIPHAAVSNDAAAIDAWLLLNKLDEPSESRVRCYGSPKPSRGYHSHDTLLPAGRKLPGVDRRLSQQSVGTVACGLLSLCYR